MEFERIETPGIAHYAYLVGDQGEAAVVDPSRDVDVYVAAAQRRGLRVRYVVETHRQEDFVMGGAALAERTGARIVNGRHELFGHGDVRLDDGELLEVGGLRLRALHTPGHTPESMSYALHAGGDHEAAWGVFTGDALFYGDTGRTDLPDAARTAENAALLFDSVHRRIAPLGDGALVLPAHGPGSVCGAGMAALPFSTLAAEKAGNIVFRLSREAFAKRKAAERLPRPPYFRRMEEVNLRGGLPLPGRPEDVPMLQVADFAQRCERARVIDTREPEGFAGGHVPGALSIWLDGLPVFGGWLARHDTPVLLVLERDEDAREATLHLWRIGIDNLQGILAGGFGRWRRSGRDIETTGVTTPRAVRERREGLAVLDVREIAEFESGHIPGARHVYVGELERRAGELELELDKARPLAVTCGVGHRAGVAASVLQRAGFRDVRNLLGGMQAWKALDLPVEERG